MSRKHCLKLFCRFLRNNTLVVFLIVAMISGIGLGCALRTMWSPLEKRKIGYLKFPGDIMLNTLRMVSVPLVVSGIITSLATLSMKTSGSIGLRALCYYLFTTVCAVITGIVGVVLVQPGKQIIGVSDKPDNGINHLDSFLDMIRNALPDNIMAATFSKKRTVVAEEIVIVEEGYIGDHSNNGNHTVLNITGTNMTIDVPSLESDPGTNMLGLIVISVLVGCVLSSMEERAKPMTDLFRCLYEVVMRLIEIFIWFTPVGLLFLTAASVVQTENPTVVLQELAVFFPTAIICILLHSFGSLSLLFLVVTKKNPFLYLLHMSKALLTAFGTASSAATLPVTMDCLVNKNHVDRRVVDFITPIGSVINMDGTALYVSMVTIFISQRLGATLTFGDYIIIGFTAFGISVGSAGVPNMGIMTMAIAAMAVGLPVDQVLLVAPVDWIVERFRTISNIYGDSIGAGIVQHLSSNVLVNFEKESMRPVVVERLNSHEIEESDNLV
ncbi:excitatory amino acid transporter 1-like isoform X1 [Argopecten irradians]|uniref:excitatory amino acid transporter 1-like isoform X1 n=1 Tax=Argopecten irradians TaxID=31199 RepID=UPI0037101555